MGKFGYIDLHGNFMNPSLYKAWTRLDKRIRNIVHGIGFYRIDDRGQIVEDEKGKTGIDFLYKNIKKIKFKTSSSSIQDIRYKYLEQNRDNIFMTKMSNLHYSFYNKFNKSSLIPFCIIFLTNISSFALSMLFPEIKLTS